MNGPWEVVGNPTEGYRVRNKDTGRHSTATPSHSLEAAGRERARLNRIEAEDRAERAERQRNTHTPGPWEFTPGDCYDVRTQYHLELCQKGLRGDADSILYHGANWPVTVADQALIAAAPNMEEALADLIEAVRLVRVRGMRDIPELVEPHERACVVLAMARGES